MLMMPGNIVVAVAAGVIAVVVVVVAVGAAAMRVTCYPPARKNFEEQHSESSRCCVAQPTPADVHEA